MKSSFRTLLSRALELWPWVAFWGLVFLPLLWLLAQAGGLARTREIIDLMERIHFSDLLANSVFLAQLTTLFALLLGLPLALILNLRDFRGRRIIGLLYILPLLIPPHIHCIAWTRVIGDQGWLTAILGSMGGSLDVRAALASPGTPLLGNLYPGAAWIMACAFFPLVTLSVSAGVRQLDAAAIEAARLQGGQRSCLWRVILPQLAPRIVAGAVFVFVLALSTYPVVSLLDTPVLIQAVYTTFQGVDQGAGAVLATPLALIAGLCVLLLGWAERDLKSGASSGVIPRRRGGLRTTLLALLPLLLAAGIPLGSLLVVAGPIGGGDGPDNYQQVAARVGPAFLDSLQLALMGVAALLLVSYPLGRALARRRSALSESLAFSSLALPPVAVGVALILFWEHSAMGSIPLWFWVVSASLFLAASCRREGQRSVLARLTPALGILGLSFLIFGPLGLAEAIVDERLFLVVLAYLARFLPFVARLIRNGFRALDQDELQAARLCGHGALSRLTKVELPRMGGVLVAAGVMAYVLCITELSATLMVIPPGWQCVQIRIFNMIHYRAIGQVAALCVLTVLLAALPVILLGLLRKKKVPVL